MKTRSSILMTIFSLMLLTALVAGSWTTAYSAGLTALDPARMAAVIPTFDIVSVTTDQTVTIKTFNFPANDTFQVLMNKIGTRGVGGTVVETINSGSGGSFTKTFNIPAGLKGQYQIAIRLESAKSGFFAYNWFFNNTSGNIPDTGATPAPTLKPGTIPTFDISSVDADKTVTIKTANFPANDTFNVTMGKIGTRGVGGVNVGTFKSNAGGALTGTFNIPAELKGQRQIAIRLQSPTTGYFAYNWFWNNSTGTIPDTGATPQPAPGVIPTFSISGVVRDSKVTIRTANFPANLTFNVTMGAFGTAGIGGVSAGTYNSGTGGAQTVTFDVPASLKGSDRIAIRLQSSTTGHFAYNWFWNNTYP